GLGFLGDVGGLVQVPAFQEWIERGNLRADVLVVGEALRLPVQPALERFRNGTTRRPADVAGVMVPAELRLDLERFLPGSTSSSSRPNARSASRGEIDVPDAAAF